MFIAQFIVSPNWEQSKWSVSRMNKYVVVYSVKYYIAANRKNYCCLQQWGSNIMLSKRIQTQKSSKPGKTSTMVRIVVNCREGD